MKKIKGVLRGVVPASMALASGFASAQGTGTDFSSITAGLDGGTIATACVGAAVILALVGFAKWGSKKLGRFFG